MSTLLTKDAREVLQPIAQAYLAARVNAELWRERMTEWEREELARVEYLCEPRFIERGRPERITDPALTYLIRQPDHWEWFHEERQRFVDSLKLNLPPDCCPACVAESLQTDVERMLLDAARKHVPHCEDFTPNKLLCAGLDTYREAIRLLVEMSL